MEFLRLDSKFYNTLTKIADCLILSVLWIICSVPLFTLGASSAALYYSVCKVLRSGEGPTIRTFFRAFRDNFRQGTLVTGITLALALGITAIGSLVYSQNPTQDTLADVYLGYLIAGIIVAAWLHYALSGIAKFRNSLGAILKNSLVICLVNFPVSILMALMLTLVLVLMVLQFPRTLGALMFLPGAYAWVCSLLLERVYQKYLPEEAEEAQPE